VLITIEGVDGAGKRTLTTGLRAALEARHHSVGCLSFPRYHHSVTADLAAEALHGRHGDLSSSVYAMAVLFALDRAGARDEIGHLLAAYDVVILDRYVVSNAACTSRPVVTSSRGFANSSTSACGCPSRTGRCC
jgi:dTMP kinase